MRNIVYMVIVGLMLHVCSQTGYANTSYKDAVCLYNQKKFDQAAIAFEEITKTDINNANAYYYLGLCYLQTRRTNAAKTIFSYIVDQFSQTPVAALAKKALTPLESNNNSSPLVVPIVNSNSSHSGSNNADNLPQQLRFPYTMQGPKYMVSAAINGHTLQMCMDTGCDRIIIPIEYIDEIGLERPRSRYAGRYSGTGAGFWKVEMNIEVGSLVRHRLPVYIFDSSSWPGVPLIGNIFFEGYSRSFNTEDGTVRAIREAYQSKDVLSASGEVLIPFERDRYRNTPLINATINGHITKVMFDTGGNDSIWITYEEAQSLGIDPDNGTTQYVGSTRIPCIALTVDKVQLGNAILQDVTTMVFDKSKATWGTDIVCFGSALLNGYGYNFVIDDQAKVIRIRKQ